MTAISALRAWYSAPLDKFLVSARDGVIGALVSNSEFEVTPAQRDAWLVTIDTLQAELRGFDGFIILEFTIPRMGSRVDAVLLVGATIFVVEFKVGAAAVATADLHQVWDYPLDLKNFHDASHALRIVPILVATESEQQEIAEPSFAADLVARPTAVNGSSFRRFLAAAIEEQPAAAPVDPIAWASSPYRPTPTIIEAARALYRHHSVEEIARHDAGATNLRLTSRRVEDLIEEASTQRKKIICLVTGVPGAGKTLVGLNVATRRDAPGSPTHAVFLSGNGPLVAVLREALTRDEVTRQRLLGEKIRKGVVANRVKAFIQNVHHFRDEALIDAMPPDDRVAIFDEAQRAWNARQTSSFMRRKKNRPDFTQSEPEFLISYMDRHADWAAIICLVGGGQEINTGEAGISAWLDALETHFPKWEIHMSPHISDSEYGISNVDSGPARKDRIHFDSDLHLGVSMRSYRAENASAFVKAVLDCEVREAEDHLRKLAARFPTAITRDIHKAKEWIRGHVRGSERCGLVASSKAMRLKPHAIDVRVSIDPVHWFLAEESDPRSSSFLEDAATEFQVQGLELDWVCLNWDADLRKAAKGWSYHDYRGARWQNIKDPDNKTYLKNAYRVLLTRARQGMVIFVPPGDARDATRLPEFYDGTYEYLRGLGITALDG
jgi:hypothetical protein